MMTVGFPKMKTTNAEGGMVDNDNSNEGEAASIMQMAMDASTLCSCFTCCRTKVDEAPAGSVNMHTSTDSRHLTVVEVAAAVPSLNQDMWLQYLYTNLTPINDIEWVSYLIDTLHKLETSFNPG